MKGQNLINKWNILIASLFGVFALILILADIHFTVPGTSILTDPREVFVLLSAALTGPIGAILTGVLASAYDPTPSLQLYVIFQHVFGAIIVSFLYKKFVFEKFVMPFFISAWILLVFIYYYVLYIPGYVAVYFVFPEIYNILTSNDPNPISALIKIYGGWTFEIVFTSLITILFLIALPHRYRIPFWGQKNEPEIGVAQKNLTNFLYKKLFSHNYLGFRLGIWYLLLSLIPFFVIQAFIHNDIYEQFLELSKQRHEILLSNYQRNLNSVKIIIETDLPDSINKTRHIFITLNDYDLEDEEVRELVRRYNEGSINNSTIIDEKLNLIVTTIADKEKMEVQYYYTSLNSTSDLLKTLESKASRNLGISLIIIVLLAGIAVWLIIVRPINRLTLALKKVGDGDYRVKIPTREMDDELGVMASSFNVMTQKIKSAYEQVAEEVENRLLAEATMMRSEENLKRITDNILDVVLETDNKFLIKYASPSTLKVFNKEHADLIGCKFLDIVNQNNIENVAGILERLKKSRKPVQFEFLMRNEERSSLKVFLESISNPLLDENDRLTGFIFTLRDITERKDFEKNLERAKEKAEKSDKLKSEFLAQMSHEIRTPINSILNFTQLIKFDVQDNLSDDLKDSFSIINTSSNRLIRTIDSILNLSQLQQGSYDINLTRFNLVENIRRVIDEVKVIAAQKKLNLQLKTTEDEIYLLSDSYMVSQIAVNLIDNAIKYTEAGEIFVSISKAEGEIKLVVKDTGIGMSQKYLKKLFEPFSQEYTGYSRRFEGTGLGLALVRRYCELSNAQISVESEKGKGTTFAINFPNVIDENM